MKVLGEGQLADRVDEALRFAVTKDAVHCFTLGCESRAEFEGNFARIAKVSQAGLNASWRRSRFFFSAKHKTTTNQESCHETQHE